MATTIQLGVENFSDFIFRFTIDFNWGRWWLDAIQDDIGCGKLELRDMEDGMNCVHRVGKADGKG